MVKVQNIESTSSEIITKEACIEVCWAAETEQLKLKLLVFNLQMIVIATWWASMHNQANLCLWLVAVTLAIHC